MAEEKSTWLSKESFERLSAELETMKTVERAEIVERIEAARSEGDLSENGGYHAAREEQSKLEGRIQELTYLLEHAEVGENPTSVETVAPGLVITAELNGKERRFLLGSREGAGDVDIDVFPESAPMGAAIMGLKVGDCASYTAPNGKEFTAKVTKIEALEAAL